MDKDQTQWRAGRKFSDIVNSKKIKELEETVKSYKSFLEICIIAHPSILKTQGYKGLDKDIAKHIEDNFNNLI